LFRVWSGVRHKQHLQKILKQKILKQKNLKTYSPGILTIQSNVKRALLREFVPVSAAAPRSAFLTPSAVFAVFSAPKYSEFGTAVFAVFRAVLAWERAVLA
jgi:hypothetical protein